MFGDKEGWSIRTLPQSIAMGIDPSAIEGDAELLKTKVSGDWIVREGVPAEQLILRLEAILQRAVRQRITLTLRRVERDVVVARGRYRSSPLPVHGEGEIEIYSRTRPGRRRGQWGRNLSGASSREWENGSDVRS